jgi:ribonucleoside-diphosphate reductase alpha chain
MLEELKSFQNDIIKKKYCLDNESSYEDILNNRFMPFFKEKINDDMKLKSIEDMLLHRRFIFGGSILRAFRSNKKMSLSNCYVLKFDGDSIEDIFSFLQKAARTMSYGGGVGEDISILRPKDAPVENAAKSSTGAVSFMPLIDLTTKTI